MTFLYRYYGRLDFVLDAIDNRRIYFASPSAFNDPYDCRPKFSLSFCKNDPERYWKRYFFLLAKNQYPGISEREARKHSQAAIAKGKHRDKVWLGQAAEAIRTLGGTPPRICCFSKSPRNPMMWAHYANNHKGVALQFRKTLTLDVDGSYKGFHVEYYRRRIPLKRYVKAIEASLRTDPLAFARLIYCSKSHEWNSEQEVRIFSHEPYLTYPEEMLTGVLLGSECGVDWENQISAAFSSWASKPKLFREDRSISSVKLCFRHA